MRIRKQMIKFTGKGPYVTHKGTRHYLEEFVTVTPFEKHGHEWHAASFLLVWGGVFISLCEDNHAAYVMEEYC